MPNLCFGVNSSQVAQCSGSIVDMHPKERQIESANTNLSYFLHFVYFQTEGTWFESCNNSRRVGI